jgi:hypothetical protein
MGLAFFRRFDDIFYVKTKLLLLHNFEGRQVSAKKGVKNGFFTRFCDILEKPGKKPG